MVKVDMFSLRKISKEHLLLVFIFAVGFILRLYKLGTIDLWWDEACSFDMASNFNIHYIFNYDFHPPLYYILLNYWMKLFGVSEFMMRLPSVIFSSFTIPVIYRIGKSLFNGKVGLLTALIFTLSPFQIWYAQEARGYAMSIFLVSITVMFLVKVLYEEKTYLWKYFIIMGLLCIFTEYINMLILFSFTPLFLFKKDLLKKWLISWGALLSGFLFLSRPFYTQLKKLIDSNSWWIKEPSNFPFIQTLKHFGSGYESHMGYIVLVLFVFFASLALFKLLNRKSKLAFISLPFFVVITVVFTISKNVGFSVYLDRQLICLSIFYYLLVAYGIGMYNNNNLRKTAVLTVIIFSIVSLKDYYWSVLPNAKKPFKPLVEFLDNYKREGDIFIFGTQAAICNPMKFYYFKDIEGYYFICDPPYISKYMDFKNKYPVKDIVSHGTKRVWLLTSSWKRNGTTDHVSKVAKRELLNYGKITQTRVFDGIFVDLFEIRRNIYEN